MAAWLPIVNSPEHNTASELQYTQQRLANGLSRIALQNPWLQVAVLPEAGGKISEISNLDSGRQWLWHNPAKSHGRPSYGADYAQELDTGGWDEVLLSLSPTELPTAQPVPDHGDVVGREWQLNRLEQTVSGVICSCSVESESLGYRLERCLTLPPDSATLIADYQLFNLGTGLLPWYWCAHILFAAQTDTCIDLPAGLDFHRNSFGAERHAWPLLQGLHGTSNNLSQPFNDRRTEGHSAKLFISSPDSGICSIKFADSGEQLTLRYNPAQLPWLGLWLNNRGWAGMGHKAYRNIGIEPSTAAHDCLHESEHQRPLKWLAPGEKVAWQLRLEFHRSE